MVKDSYSKLMAAGVSMAIVAAAVPAVQAEAASNFTDVKTDAWYYEHVDYLVNKGVLKGYDDNTFRPGNTLTRAEAAAIITSTLNLSTDENVKLPFKDTKDDAWYAKPIAALVDLGVIDGFNDGTFQPNAPVTRAQFAKMVVEAYELEEKKNAEITFKDVVDNAWFKDVVYTLAAYGIVGGKPNGNFEPNETVLRSEAAAFIHRTEVPEKRLHVEDEEKSVISNVVVNVNDANVVNVQASVNDTEEKQAEIVIFKDSTKVASEIVEVKNNKVQASFKELPVGDYVAKITVGEEEAEQAFKVEAIEVNSIVGTTTIVDADRDEQVLGFTVNGETISLNYLKEMGYKVEFLVSKENVLKNKETGELNKDHLISGDSFDYQVKLTKGEQSVTSDVKTVAVESYASSIVSIDGAELYMNDGVKNVSGTISTQDSNVRLTNIAVNYRDGNSSKVDVNAHDFTFTSSDPTVALIDKQGRITPIADGRVTFTIKHGEVSDSITVNVTTEAREASKADVSSKLIGLVTERKTTIALTVIDQFGDPVKGFAVPIELVKNEDDDTILEAKYHAPTDENGKTIIEVKALKNEGAGKLEIKNDEGDVLTSLHVTVDGDEKVASRALELADPSSDATIDVNPFLEEEHEVALVLREYNKAGLLVGVHDFTNSPYTIESSDEDVLTVSKKVDGTIVAKAVGKGKASVQIKEGTIVRYDKEVTVLDTTPALANATFKNDLKITSTDALAIDDILDLDSLTFSGEKGEASVAYEVDAKGSLIISLEEGAVKQTVATVSAFSVDIDDVGFFEDSQKIYLGNIKDEAGFAKDTDGTIVLRLNSTNKLHALTTAVIQVNVK